MKTKLLIAALAITSLSSCLNKKENKMEQTNIKEFKVIGISVRTTNENSKAAEDIPQLWNRFMTENILVQIPNKIDNSIYSIYTDYEGDYMKPYTTILACRVSSIDDIPEGMVAKTIKTASYKQYTAKGSLSKGVVYEAWTKIWSDDIDRAYVADYEVYGPKSQNPEDAEVDIFVGVR